MSITILTGAGASRALNYPTTIEFFDHFSDNEKNQHKGILDKLRQQLGTSQLDVEDVLFILDPIENIAKTPSGQFLAGGITNGWLTLISNFSKACQNKCFSLYGRSPDEDKVEEYYIPLLEACDWVDKKISIYTTNYDPVTDTLMDIAEERLVESTDGFSKFGNWNPKEYAQSKKGLSVYRLHGSMSWVRNNGKIKNTRDYSIRQGDDTKHLLIYPGYKGDPENDVEEAYSHPHKALRLELNKSKIFIAIGFAFRDNHINSILKDAMENNPDLKLIIINPEFPDGEDGFLTNLQKTDKNRVFHINKRFGDESLNSDLSKVIKGIPKL